MLFMGQEWAAGAPFPFFTDHPGEVGTMMAEYRRREFRHIGAVFDEALLAHMPDPQAEATFHSAKLDWRERDRPPHAAVLELYRACLRLRAAEAFLQSPERDAWTVEPLGEHALELRWRAGWRLVFSLAAGASLRPSAGTSATLVLSSNAPRFGGAAESELLAPGAALWRD
jgi:maltooligosyltrehalose trehalohydrolase